MKVSDIEKVQSSLIINQSILIHRTGVKFVYLGTEKPQFTQVEFVNLKNIKTGKIESFLKDTYLRYFELIKKK